MLEIIKLLDKPIFNRNKNNKLVYKKNNGNSKINKFGTSNNSIEYAKKTRNLKDKKMFKF